LLLGSDRTPFLQQHFLRILAEQGDELMAEAATTNPPRLLEISKMELDKYRSCLNLTKSKKIITMAMIMAR